MHALIQILIHRYIQIFWSPFGGTFFFENSLYICISAYAYIVGSAVYGTSFCLPPVNPWAIRREVEWARGEWRVERATRWLVSPQKISSIRTQY